MHSLVELGEIFQRCGTDCLVVAGDRILLQPHSVEIEHIATPLQRLLLGGGDAGLPLHVLDRAGRWRRVEPIVHSDQEWLVALLPRTCQRVLLEADHHRNHRRALEEIATSTAREMNDAMTIIQGRLELLLSFLDRPDAVERHATIALDHAARITSALHNLRLLGTSGIDRFGSLALREQLESARATLPNPSAVEIAITPKNLKVVGHAPSLQSALVSTFRALLIPDGGRVEARAAGDRVEIRCVAPSSRATPPVGMVGPLLRAMGGDLRSDGSQACITLPREMRPRGLIPHGKHVLAVGSPSFTHPIADLLAPDVEVRTSRDAERATGLDDPLLHAVVTELVLPGISGLCWIFRLRRSHPELRTLLVLPECLTSLPDDIPHLAGPLDRARLVHALTR